MKLLYRNTRSQERCLVNIVLQSMCCLKAFHSVLFFSQNSAIEIKDHNQHFGHNEICILLMVICIHNINMEKREKLQKTNLKPLITNPVVPRGFISCSLDGFVPWQSTGYVICQNQSIIIKTNNKRSI